VVCTGGEVGLSASAVTTAVPDTVMVFAAGLGKRMRPITATMPKPLVKIAGRTMIDHMLDRFADIGVNRAIVNVHYLAEQLEQHLAARKTPEIIISDERDKLLDQGGGIKKVLPLLGHKPFFICNTDAIWLEGARSNLALLRERWDPHAMDVLLLVAASATSVGVDWAGDFLMDADGRLTRRREGQVAPFVYAGVGIIKPQLFADVGEDVLRLAPYFFAAAERGRLFGHRLDGQWLHVGTPAAVEEAERAIARSAR
jgi:N-acetyl-alpha-D-muramate 1-phosphate uridylyltransferase